MTFEDERSTHSEFNENSEDVFHLESGYIFFGAGKKVVRAVLGSSVCVCLWDRRLLHGGINHFSLPVATKNDKTTPKYGNVATKILLKTMFEAGSHYEDIIAQIVGGAHREEHHEDKLGLENINVAKKILEKVRINITSEDTGGNLGRKIVFDIHTGHLMVMKVHKIRSSDWIDNNLTEPSTD